MTAPRRADQPHVGLVVPPANPAAEPETHELLSGRARCHTARLPVLCGIGLKSRLQAYHGHVADALAGFGDLRLSAVLVACTGSSYLLGPEGDREASERIATTLGAPVASAAAAILARLEQLGHDEVVLASPYVPWLTELAHGFWQAAGIHVAATIEVRAGDRFAPYEVTGEDITGAVRGARPGGDAPILFSGTGMPTLDAIDELALDAGRPLLSSNLCGAAWLLDRVAELGTARA